MLLRKQGRRMRSRLGTRYGAAVCIVVALGTLAWLTVGDNRDASAANVPEFTTADIPSLAVSVAARHGDPAPSLVQYSQSTRGEANLVAMGAVVPSEEKSYLIVIRGHFVDPIYYPPIPPGYDVSSQPSTMKYSVIALVVDAATGRITDSSHSDNVPDLARLGPVQTALATPSGG